MVVSAPSCVHRKLKFERPEGQLAPYADHYRFGEGEGPAPLLVYVGGAIDKATYLERSNTAPEVVRAPFARAWAGSGLPVVDLLVCPCPMETRGEGFEWFPGHLDDEVEPCLPAKPTARGFVGFSAGASQALYTALLDDDVRVAAVLGSAGVTRVVKDLENVLNERLRQDLPLELALFHNAGDNVQAPATYRAALRSPLQPTVMASRAGVHSFRDYVGNGSVEATFRFVLERLRGPSGR
jgi:hypothetical protein